MQPLPEPQPNEAESIEPVTIDPDSVEDDAADHTGPLRRCLVTRETHARETMLRFVVGPDSAMLGDALVFDVAATLPGRGLWLSARRDVVDMALKRGVFSKAARKRLITPERLADRVEHVLENRVIELLGLARRAGAAVGGYEKVKERLGAGQTALLVAASDGSEAEQARLRGHHQIAVVRPLTAQRLGAVFGRDRTVHVSIGPGKLAGMIEIEAIRLAGTRSVGLQASAITGNHPPDIASLTESGQREPQPG
jgi:predicted RNA-binding protein YlxR (DUF448 family)